MNFFQIFPEEAGQATIKRARWWAVLRAIHLIGIGMVTFSIILAGLAAAASAAKPGSVIRPGRARRALAGR